MKNNVALGWINFFNQDWFVECVRSWSKGTKDFMTLIGDNATKTSKTEIRDAQ